MRGFTVKRPMRLKEKLGSNLFLSIAIDEPRKPLPDVDSTGIPMHSPGFAAG
jgi:hypothetical protein